MENREFWIEFHQWKEKFRMPMVKTKTVDVIEEPKYFLQGFRAMNTLSGAHSTGNLLSMELSSQQSTQQQ